MLPDQPFSVGFTPAQLATWPATLGCAACRCPWSAHGEQADMQCGLCGAPLDPACYYRLTATAAEMARRDDPEDEMDDVIFQCRACRQ